MRLTTLELHKDEFSFSAGHFTIFSQTEREDLHGHNYYVHLSMQMLVGNTGLAFDYRVYKAKIHSICAQLDRRFLLPNQSPYLKLEEQPDMWVAHYGDERIPFLKRDVVILPITNVTIEELSHWFLSQLTENPLELKQHHISEITVKVFNGPGQSGGATWTL